MREHYLWNRWTDLHETLYADPLWPWLGPPPGVALCYVLPVLRARPGRSLMSMNVCSPLQLQLSHPSHSAAGIPAHPDGPVAYGRRGYGMTDPSVATTAFFSRRGV